MAIFWLSTKCRPTIDRVSTNYWPIGQVSTNYRWSVGEVLVKCRRNVGEVSAKKSAKCRWTKSYIGRDTSGTTIKRVSTECRPTINRLSTAISTGCRLSVDRVSTEYRPTVNRVLTDYRPSLDWLSTECRPLYRPISRSTLPTVNKIPTKYMKRLTSESIKSYMSNLDRPMNWVRVAHMGILTMEQLCFKHQTFHGLNAMNMKFL